MTTIPTTKREIASFLKALAVPRGATHFCMCIAGRNPLIDKIKNLDVAAGCSGLLEFGKTSGRGRARIFTAMPWQAPEATTEQAVQDAAVVIESEATTTTAKTTQRGRRKGTRHTILGHSACAVIKALGKAGVKYPEADTILKGHGIEMPKASVSVQLGFGRNEKSWERHGQPAPLSEAEIRELRSASAA